MCIFKTNALYSCITSLRHEIHLVIMFLRILCLANSMTFDTSSSSKVCFGEYKKIEYKLCNKSSILDTNGDYDNV